MNPMQFSMSGETAMDNVYGPHYDDIIPPFHENRTLVLCFDGTGDQFDADVRKFGRLTITERC
jgi:hypothetical protein